jgi:quinolinate synthase
MARNTLEKVRECLLNGAPEITWQPEFERAREVLQRSLLDAASAAGPVMVSGD